MIPISDLRDARRAREEALADSQGLDLARITTWTREEIDPIEEELLACTTDFGDAVADLGDALEAMTADELSDWFDSIEWEPVGSRMTDRITDYMRRG
jgi:hypothetical protein